MVHLTAWKSKVVSWRGLASCRDPPMGKRQGWSVSCPTL